MRSYFLVNFQAHSTLIPLPHEGGHNSLADGRCLGFRDKEVQGTCLGMRDKEVKWYMSRNA